MKRVLIVQAVMKQYREPFFRMLHEKLIRDGIELTVTYSEPNRHQSARNDNVDLPKPIGRKVKGFWFCDNSLLLQPALAVMQANDLIILEQASKHLLNLVFLALSNLKLKKVAFWGHGRNRDTDRSVFSEGLKRTMLNSVDWWFAYTAGTAAYLASHGVHPDRITNVQNAIDTMELRNLIEGLDDAELRAARQKFQLGENAPTGIYCGSLSAQKLGILLTALPLIKQAVPYFQLLIVGTGENVEQVKELAAREAWIHYVGARFGAEKALLLRLSDVFMMPEAAGLSVLDAFAAGLPFLTTKAFTHGPEVEYIDDGVNGIVADHDALSYASAVARVLSDSDLKNRLSEGARRSGHQYTVEEMAERFRRGIGASLGLSKEVMMPIST